MKLSNLQFSNPHIEKIDFRLNNEIVENVNDLPIDINVKTFVSPSDNKAIASLYLTVGELINNDKIKTAFYFDGIITAGFTWDNEVINPEEMLKISGGTVLLSYIRPILASITMQAGITPVNLPFVNFAGAD